MNFQFPLHQIISKNKKYKFHFNGGVKSITLLNRGYVPSKLNASYMAFAHNCKKI